jgi:ribonuclease VapC
MMSSVLRTNGDRQLAVVAILFKEAEAEWFESAVLRDAMRYMSAASLLESSIVLDCRYGDKAFEKLDGFIIRTGIEIVPVSAAQAQVARDAFRKYGKGRHKAGLNFGDCFSYALAKVSGEPLLSKGNDFAFTDLAVISPPPSPQNK